MDKILPDVIVSWPKHLDYPLWREQIHNNRDRFNKVIVVFTNMNVFKDYEDFVRVAMKDDDITFVTNELVTGGDDWRNVSVNTGLRKSKAVWVFFTEQDFYWKSELWEVVDKCKNDVSIMAAFIEGRMHPCCILAKRNLIERTRKDFGVTTDRLDHFGKFQEDVNFLSPTKLYLADNLYEHLGGLSQNMYLMKDTKSALYFPEAFKKYCEDCLKVTVPMHRDFERMFNEYIHRSTP